MAVLVWAELEHKLEKAEYKVKGEDKLKLEQARLG